MLEEYTKDNPAYLYSINYRNVTAPNFKVRVTPVCDFIPLYNSVTQSQVRTTNFGDFQNVRSMFFVVYNSPYLVMTNRKRFYFACWSPDPDSSLARMAVLEEVDRYIKFHIRDLHRQLRIAHEKRDIIEQLISEERTIDGR